MPAALIVDADDASAASLADALRGVVETTLHARDGLEALRLFYENPIEFAVIGFPVAKFDGVDLVRLLRNLSGIPLLVLAASPNTATIVRLLEAGADDVIGSRVPSEELLARIRATSRRATREVPPVGDQGLVRTGDLVIDRTKRLVTKSGRVIGLSQTEYRLLDALSSHVGRVAPHRFLLSTVWGDAFVDDTHYLRMYIGYLRAKLEDDPAQPVYLRNEWGTGYRLALLPIAPADRPQPTRAVEADGEGIELHETAAEAPTDVTAGERQ
jgi:two-component system, OmpR family, KDP operon response regulator KdpE